MLDIIGYSTLPDDAVVAADRLGQFFLWLMSVPWWAVFGFVLLTTMWLMWVSWPRAPDTNGAFLVAKATTVPLQAANRLSSILLDLHSVIERLKRAAAQPVRSPSIRKIIVTNVPVDVSAKVKSVFASIRAFGIPTLDVGSVIAVERTRELIDYFETIYPFVGASQVDEAKSEAARFIAERQQPTQ